ncbi:MAG: ribonuclease D [Gammaproteobacteria bacterium]|nr:ribonuclease D [Gammaproteobacteria bacterium]
MAETEFVFVESAAALITVCEQLANADTLAVDTEFTREKTYYPQLGLVQIASPSLVACIDPIAVSDLQVLRNLLLAPAITKVLHAARQDIEVVWQHLQVVPTPIMDTQLAASFLGLHEQISYAALVEHFLGITLAKGQTRTDWCQRPLSQAQLHYAADDVRYLSALFPLLRQRLQQAGRWEWCQNECLRLQDTRGFLPNLASLWSSVAGQQYLSAAQLAVLQSLAGWREERAQQSNRPRQWVLRDEQLIALAQQAPTHLAALRQMGQLPAGLVERHAAVILQRIAQALALPSTHWPVPQARDALSNAQKTLLGTITQRLREIAQQQQITTSLLATRKELERLITQQAPIALFSGWRYELAGKAIESMLPAQLLPLPAPLPQG